MRELVHRDVRIDKIVKHAFIINDTNTFYGVALRDSGKFDIYWDMTLVDSPENGISFTLMIYSFSNYLRYKFKL